MDYFTFDRDDGCRKIVMPKEECPTCSGRGTIAMTEEEFETWLYDFFYFLDPGGMETDKDVVAFRKQWEDTGEVSCEKCEGSGDVDV